MTLVNRATVAEHGTRPFSVDELRMAQQAASELVGPMAILDGLGRGSAPAHRDGLLGAFGDDFVSDLLALNETGRRAVQAVVAVLIRDQHSERP